MDSLKKLRTLAVVHTQHPTDDTGPFEDFIARVYYIDVSGLDT
jgi:hypothetical protein